MLAILLVSNHITKLADKYAEIEADNTMAGMGVSYDGLGSELITESEKGLWKAGKRCPELFLKRSRVEETIRLYSMLNYGNYLVLSIGGSGHHEYKGELSGPSTPLRLLPPGSASESSDDSVFTSELVSSDDHFTVIVRPDMYISEVITKT